MSTSPMSLADLRALPHLSVSQVRGYLTCPRRFFFQYVEHAEAAFRPIALAFGTAWHETIGTHLSPQVKDQFLSRQELHALFRDSLTEEVNKDGPPVLFENDESLCETIDLGLRMVDEFVLRIRRPDEVLDVERAFVLELAHPGTGEVAPVPLIGAIDAIVVDKGKIAVWELKSSRRRWSTEQVAQDAQLSAYAMAARELGYDDAELALLITTKTKTPEIQVERLVRHRADKEEFVETALTVLRAVDAGIDYRVRGWSCKSCAYAGLCGP
jgi:CRISPR/Cas system-associated exonuclease Cas4 (RecB family)